jgi:hypothetical protein
MRGLPVIVASIVLLAGCGGGDSDDPAEPVRVYFDALADGNGERACGQVTGAAQREMVGYAAEMLPEFRITSCASAIRRLAGVLGPDERALLKEASFTVKRNGDQATVTPKGAARPAQVERISGRWLIAGGLTGP